MEVPVRGRASSRNGTLTALSIRAPFSDSVSFLCLDHLPDRHSPMTLLRLLSPPWPWIAVCKLQWWRLAEERGWGHKMPVRKCEAFMKQHHSLCLLFILKKLWFKKKKKLGHRMNNILWTKMNKENPNSFGRYHRLWQVSGFPNSYMISSGIPLEYSQDMWGPLAPWFHAISYSFLSFKVLLCSLVFKGPPLPLRSTHCGNLIFYFQDSPSQCKSRRENILLPKHDLLVYWETHP